ncbi:putative T7SS-secreted protein, partial [Microbacterium sp.]|uniref:putative T7SS-secreted protein n=1 Tax=Microbacterium sp. TaxID=51671 RepID=UPI0039E60084
MELGQTQNAVDLIPGSASNARDGAAAWRDIADRAGEARAAFAKLDDDGSWSGAAYDRYVERFEEQLSYWQTTSDTFTAAANALENYAGALEWAQGQAAIAIELWNAAEAKSAAALVAHQEYVRSLRRGAGIRHVDVDVPFVDPAGPAYREAREVLANARYQLDVLATGYANIIGEAGDAATLPLTPAQEQQAAADAIARTVIEVGVVQPFLATLNFLGSIAETMWEHPDLVLEMLLGIGGMVGGGALIIGGGGLEVVTLGGGTVIAAPAVVGGAALAGG